MLDRATAKLKTPNYTPCPGKRTTLLQTWRSKGSAFSLPGHFHSALLARAIKACAAKLNQRSNGARATAHKTGKTLRDARKGKQGFRRPTWYLWPGKTAPDKWFDYPTLRRAGSLWRHIRYCMSSVLVLDIAMPKVEKDRDIGIR